MWQKNTVTVMVTVTAKVLFSWYKGMALNSCLNLSVLYFFRESLISINSLSVDDGSAGAGGALV